MDTVRLETMAQTSAITASSVNHGTRETTIGIYGNACSSSGRMCVTVPSSAASANMKAITAQMKLRTRCVFVLFSVRSGLTGLGCGRFCFSPIRFGRRLRFARCRPLRLACFCLSHTIPLFFGTHVRDHPCPPVSVYVRSVDVPTVSFTPSA